MHKEESHGGGGRSDSAIFLFFIFLAVHTEH